MTNINDRNLIITATDKQGKELEKGDRIEDFRGDHDRFMEVVRLPEEGRSAKVRTARGTYYAEVFGITVTSSRPASL